MSDNYLHFSTPKGFGVCPVLLHLGPISDALVESRYVYKVIDMTEFLMDQQLPLEIFPGEMTSNAIFFVALLRKPHGRGFLHRTAKNLAIRRIPREKIS